MSHPVSLLSVATAVPAHCIEQGDAAAAAYRSFASRYREFDRLSRVFDTSGILRRYAVRPLDWYFSFPPAIGIPSRHASFLLEWAI